MRHVLTKVVTYSSGAPQWARAVVQGSARGSGGCSPKGACYPKYPSLETAQSFTTLAAGFTSVLPNNTCALDLLPYHPPSAGTPFAGVVCVSSVMICAVPRSVKVGGEFQRPEIRKRRNLPASSLT